MSGSRWSGRRTRPSSCRRARTPSASSPPRVRSTTSPPRGTTSTASSPKSGRAARSRTSSRSSRPSSARALPRGRSHRRTVLRARRERQGLDGAEPPGVGAGSLRTCPPAPSLAEPWSRGGRPRPWTVRARGPRAVRRDIPGPRSARASQIGASKRPSQRVRSCSIGSSSSSFAFSSSSVALSRFWPCPVGTKGQKAPRLNP